MKNTMQKLAFLLMVFILFVTVPYTTKASTNDDITGHWHEKELREMIDKKVIGGYGNGIYKPDGQVTRGQFAAIIARTLNLEEPAEGIVFTDLHENSGVVKEVIAAAGAGIVTGYEDDTFKPADLISRQHMAVIVERALNYMKMDDKTNTLNFADTASILKAYRPAVSNTVNYKIFSGSQMNNGVYFRPEDNATRGDAAAVMSRFLNAVENEEVVPPGSDKPTPPEDKPTPPVDKPTPPVDKPSPTFNTESIQADGSTKVIAKYDSYEKAHAALKTDQVLTYDEAIIKMPSGIVISKPTVTSGLTNIYTTSDLRTAETYVTQDTELEYVNSTDKYVQIKLAGKSGFIKHENAILKPWKAVKERSYYSVSNGSLNHHIYSNKSGKYSVVNGTGKAPQDMVAGQKYFSWDGINYYHSTTSKKVTGYPYFQYLPARSTTNYTAEEIDTYIMKMLKSLETSNPNNATYKNASKKSKLIGLGKYLKKIEKEQKVNAMLVLSLAQHESAYGLSARAQDFNNLFGLRVFDDNPDDYHFKTVEASVDKLMVDYFNKNYIPPNAPYANGAVFGNKAMGFNMKYASDPYWGEKAAGHWYRADKMMGGKDLAKAYKVGLTTSTGLNARTGSGTTNKAVFTYSKANLPVIIVENVNPKPWIKIVSDHVSYNELYVSGDYMKEIPLIK